jgi:tight adherence protein B
MDYSFYLFVICVFLAVVMLIEGGFLAWNSSRGPEAKRLSRRLRMLSAGGHGADRVALMKQRNLSQVPTLDALLLKVPRVHQLDRVLMQSGADWSVGKLLGLCLAMGLIAYVIAALLHQPGGIRLSIAAMAAALPLLRILGLRGQRMRKLDEQLPEALDLITRALLSGHAFHGALQMVAEECPDPIAAEFRITFEEINYGISVKDALLNLAARVPSTDLRYFVIAVLIQRETGGNLAELLGNISNLIRARFKLLGTVRVLSAEGRLSAWVLTLLPISAALLINLVNPGFLDVLWTEPLGLKLIKGALAMMVIGIVAMWRMVKIRV